MSLVGKIKLNSKLLINVKNKIENKPCIVKYIGAVEGNEGEFIGVQLETPDGTHNGTVNNKKYFVCKDKHGMLVKPKSCNLPDGTPLESLIKKTALSKNLSSKNLGTGSGEKLQKQQKTQKVEKLQKTQKTQKTRLSKQLQIVSEMQSSDSGFYQSQLGMTSHLNTNNEELQKQNKQLKEQLEQFQKKFDILKTQNIKLKSNFDKDKEKDDKIEVKGKQLTEQLDFWKNQNKNWEKEKKNMEKKIQRLEAEIQAQAQNQDMLMTLSVKIQNLQNKNETLKQELQNKKIELRNIQSTTSLQKTETQGEDKTDLTQDLLVLNETVTLLQSDLKEQKQKNQQLTKQLLSNQQKIAQYTKIQSKLKKRQVQVQQLKQSVEINAQSALFAQKLTMKLMKKQQQLTEANKNLNDYIQKYQAIETNYKKNDQFIKQYQETVQLQEEDIKIISKKLEERDIQINQLNKQIQKYKQKITQLAKSNENLLTTSILADEPKDQGTQLRAQFHHDIYQQKYFEALKSFQSISEKYVQSQTQYSSIKNQIGVYVLNLMEGLPESFMNKLYPEVIEVIVQLKSINQKLFLLYETTCNYLRQKNNIYSKDNIQLALWMLLLLDKISIIYGYFHRIQLALITSSSEEQLSSIISDRSLKTQVSKVDTFTLQILARFSGQNLSSAVDIQILTPSSQLQRIQSAIKRTFTNQYQIRMKLCTQAMKVLYSTFNAIINFKMVSQLQENAQIDINIENFIKLILVYLKECCNNSHIRYRQIMNKYLSGITFIANIFNQIQNNQSNHELGNLYSQTQQIKILRETIVTTQVYTKQLLSDLQDIQYPTNLSRIHQKLQGEVWTNRIKTIKQQLLRVKEVLAEKEQLEINNAEAKKKIWALERQIKDKQHTIETYSKRIGQLQIKVQQASTLQKDIKKQAEKIKNLEENNTMLQQQINSLNKKKIQMEEDIKTSKKISDQLKKQIMFKEKKKTTSLSTDEVANLTIFKNVVKEANLLKFAKYKQKCSKLIHSPIFKVQQTTKEDSEAVKLSNLRRKALETMSKLKIFDPRATPDPNQQLISSLFSEASKLQFNKDAQKAINKNIVEFGYVKIKNTTKKQIMFKESRIGIHGF